ncbi:MAG: ATP-dependent metallopeptidase FtsH/Yme1/Tma family protein, partial [Acidobacteria bacterium]|nr:ATP-dependent metallopeptidase FtsH/Yme1/Tma family protein [Acidobacteriota bacterium]
MWYVLGFFVLLAVLQSVLASLSAGTTIPYSEFKTQLREGRIVSVVVSEERVRGTLNGDDGVAKPFSTVRIEDPKLIEELQSANIKYDGEVQARWMGELLGWVLPILLLVALWTFFLRRMGGGEGGVMSFAKSKAKIYA